MSSNISLVGSKDCYGRENEKKALQEYFERSRNEGIYVTVYGRSGCGKTRLVESRPWDRLSNSQLNQVEKSGSFFVSAKFDQIQSSRPFAAISQGFNDLCEEWAKSPRGLIQIQTFCKNESHDEASLQQFLPSLYKLTTTNPKDDSTTSVASLASTCSSITIGSLGSKVPSFKEPIDHRRSFERLRTLIYKLLRFMSREQSKVIVVLLNDLQWADSMSLDLVGFLVNENISGLFLLSTYRIEEAQEDLSTSDPAKNHMHSLRLSDEAAGRVFSLSLHNFALTELNGIFSKLVHRPPEETLALVQVIQEKTGGNPLFVDQFIKLLLRQGLLSFSFSSIKWEWKDATEVRQATLIVSSEVAEMVASCMRTMHPRIQEVLKVSSCLGFSFPSVILKEYFQMIDVSVNVEDALCELEEADVVQKVRKDAASAEFYSFSHGKLHQAASSLFDDTYDLDEMRLELGKLLLKIISTQSSNLPSSSDLYGLRKEYLIYLAVDQLNHVPTALLFEAGENMRVDLAKLNLQAARLSISKSAFYPAIDLLSVGIDLLKATGKNRSLLRPAKSVEVARAAAKSRALSNGSTDSGSLAAYSPPIRARRSVSVKAADSSSPSGHSPMGTFTMLDVSDRYRDMNMWVDQYDLSLELYNNLLEMEYTVGNQENAKAAIDLVIEKAKTQEDKFRAQACLLEITANGKGRDFKGGAKMCVEILKTYGIKIPMNPNKIQVLHAKRKLEKALPNGRLEELMHLPLMKDKRAICTSLFLGKLAFFSAMAMESTLTKLVAVRSFSLSLTYGINTYTALAMASYAFVFRNEDENEAAFTFGELSYQLLQRLTSKNVPNYARVLCMIHCSIIPLKRPFPDLLEPFMDVYTTGLKAGDVESALTGAMCFGYTYIMVGLPLARLETDMEAFGQESRQFRVTPSVHVQFPIFLQTILNLRHNSPNPTALRGSAMNEDDVLDQVEGEGYAMTVRDICIFRLMLSYVFRDDSSGRANLEELAKHPILSPNIGRSYMGQIFIGLVAFMLHRKTGARKYFKMGVDALEFFQKALEKSSINAYPMLTLLQAEKAPSKEGYETAIRACARSGLTNFAAMANESTALHFLQKPASEGGDEEYGNFYMSRAISLYSDWGADAKVSRLANEFPRCFEEYKKSIAAGLTLQSSYVGRSHHPEKSTGETMHLTFSGKDMGDLSHGGHPSGLPYGNGLESTGDCLTESESEHTSVCL